MGELTRQRLWVAYAIGAFGLAMTQLSNFLVPLRARELGASFETIGLLVGTAALIPAVFSVLLGSVTDRLGPRRTFILGTGLAAVSATLYTLVTNYWLLLPLQLALGGTRSLAWIASQSYITGIGEPHERAAHAGRFSFFSNVGPMVGPLLAGGVAEIVGVRLAFLFVTGYALTFCVLGLFLAETGRSASAAAKRKGVGLRTAGRLLKLPGMQIVLLLSGARLWTNWVWTAFFPVYLVDSGLATGLAGTVVFARALCSTIVAPTTEYWTRFLSKQALTAVGLGFGALGLVISPWLTTVPEVYLASVAVGIAIGLSLPLLLAIVGDVVAEDQRGVAVGLRVSVNQSAAAIAPVAVGPLITALGAAAGFAISGGLASAMLIGALALHRRVLRNQSEPGHRRGP